MDSAVFHPDGKRFISRGVDASVRIKDLWTGEEDLFVSFTDGEWIVIASEGYYNSSEKGAQYLSVKVGGKTSYSVKTSTTSSTVLT